MTLQWNPLDGVTGYRITRIPQTGESTSVTIIGSTTTFVDSGLTNQIPYNYTVSAFNEAGEGPPSAPAGGTPFAPPIGHGEKVPPALSLTTLEGGGRTAAFTVRNSVYGHFYQLQDNRTLSINNWRNTPGVPGQPGTGGELRFVTILEPGEGRRFFRILIEL